jgi:hypothetical protein
VLDQDDLKLDELEALQRHFDLFAKEYLKVKAKGGAIVPFEKNKAQQVIFEACDRQLAEKGFVRALILKGRQQGASTGVAARYYHKASLRFGVNVFILAHEQGASDTLFDIVDRFQRHNEVRPHVGEDNAKELVFDLLESSYAVATAGAKAVGRSKSILLFHGSEVAFWTNAADHFAASVQAVPLAPGSEVILESTSAGAGGEFYERWQDAEAGRGDYIPIFLPWWLTPEYARPPEPGFTLSADADEGEMSEQEYSDTFHVPLPQMCWRRSKLIELRDPMLFQREYPAIPSEAWTAPPGMTPFIPALSVLRARKRNVEAAGPLILGVDPASTGDRFAISARRGLRVLWTRHRSNLNTLEGTQWVKAVIDETNPARVNVDSGNIGAAIVTNLKSAGPQYVKIVRGVNFGNPSEAKMARPKVAGPKNRRAEMWMRLRDWLTLEEGVQLPDDNALQSDITAPRQKPQLNNDLLLESKKELRARGIRSPDLADSVVLTFGFNEFLVDENPLRKVNPFGNPDAQQVQYQDTPPMLPWSGPTSWMGG